MSPQRQLAAIMFTDIVGYTALMGKDSEKALQVLDVSKGFQKSLVSKHDGKWLKEMGDGVLASFGSAVDAVKCAIDIQKSARAELDEKLRIGIHLGDVTVEENDVHGDGVNVASRLEAVTDPGGIYISEAIHNAVQGQTGVQTQFVGEFQLKNVAYPVRSYAIQGAGLPIPKKKITPINKSKPLGIAALMFVVALAVTYYFAFWNQEGGEGTSAVDNIVHTNKSIAVLPFADMSPDADQQYFADGVMEEILTHLHKFGDLRVTSRTSVMGYRSTPLKASTIGQELQVAHILEGSVRKDGDKVRITVQLIDAINDEHLWAENYDRELKDIFTIQSDVAKQIASTLKTTITPLVQERLENIPTSNTDAYDLFLKGRQKIAQMYEDFENPLLYQAIDYFTQALALDPGFSSAYSGLSHAYWVMGQFSPDYDTMFWINAKKYALKAIELNPYDGYAYQNLANVQYKWEGKKDSAELSFRKTVELEPGNFSFQTALTWFFFRIDDCEKLEAQAEICRTFQSNGVWDYFIPLCRRDFEKINTLNYQDFWAHGATILNFQGKYDQCIDFLTRERPIGPDDMMSWSILAEAHAYSGDTAKAIEVIRELRELSSKRYVPDAIFMPIYLALGREETAFDLLEKVVEDRAQHFMIHTWEEFFVSVNRIRDDPRYKKPINKTWQ